MKQEKLTRRAFLAAAMGGLGFYLLRPRTARAASERPISVVTPEVGDLPYTMDGNVKVFHLRAEPVRRKLLPDFELDLWGYNGSVPGPTIQVNEGDRVRIVFENRLPEPTTVHWHGLEVPNEMDGVPGVTQDPVMPGEKFVYEFTVNQNGTFFYHSHFPMQEMLGMIGFFIIHPRRAHEPPVQKDFALLVQEFAVLPGNTVPNSLSMEFNWFTINGRAAPWTKPLIVRQGERVRLRMLNLGMSHHSIHLHGHQFVITGTEGGRAPRSTWYPTNTALVGVAQVKELEFDAIYPGDWLLHCHLPHHMMNAMASMVGPINPTRMEGGEMAEGMGIMMQGHALSEEKGPKLGRGTGLMRAETVSALPGPRERKRTKRVPGYPQDMWMPMDKKYQRPETEGMRQGWSGGIQGMMLVIRVLPDEEYARLMRKIRSA